MREELNSKLSLRSNEPSKKVFVGGNETSELERVNEVSRSSDSPESRSRSGMFLMMSAGHSTSVFDGKSLCLFWSSFYVTYFKQGGVEVCRINRLSNA